MYLRDTNATYDSYGGYLLEDLTLNANTHRGILISGPANIIQNNRISKNGELYR